MCMGVSFGPSSAQLSEGVGHVQRMLVGKSGSLIVAGLAVRLWASHSSLGLCFLAWDRVIMKPAPQG